MDHDLKLVLVASGAALAAGVAGALVLHVLRRRSTAAQVVAVALTAVAAVALGSRAAVQGMLLTADDLATLDVVLAAAGVVGVAVAVILGRRIGRASDELLDVARHVGSPGVTTARVDGAPRELTELARQLEETSHRLAAARAREQALDASRRELVAWVSHDLRTPLAGIRAVTEALEDGVVTDPESVARYHRTLREEADRLAELIDDLFELSRAQAGVLRLDLQRVSLGDLVSDALAGAAPVAAAKGVRLEGRMDGPPAELRASTPELLRALRNILENAIRHTPSDGTVLVEAGAPDDEAYVVVVDTGGGIPEPDLTRVFDVAFRGDPARTKGEGSGLGLAIARGLVEAHHGRITVANTAAGPDVGARFEVRLPLEPVG